MNIRLNIVRNTAIAGVLIGSSTTLFATGFRLLDQDAFATARGDAFVATADNASAIYYNPAGISQLEGQNVRAGFYGIDLDPTYKANDASGTFHNQKKVAAVPQFFYTYNVEDCPVSGGLGIYSPYGLSVRWPQATGFRTVGTYGALTYITINPVLALKLSDHFSVGGGVTVNYARADLRQGLFWPAQDNDGFKFGGDGWDVGFNLGALWKVNEQFSLGASFRSATKPNLKGHVRDSNTVALPGIPTFRERSAANAALPTPINAIFGISYRPTPNWNIEFDADYTSWNNLQTVTIHQESPSIVLPSNIPVIFNWQSSWCYELGATRYFENGWHASTGYVFNENAMPAAHYIPQATDEDRHFFSIGGGHKGKHIDFDVAYQFGYGPTRTVSGSTPSLAGQSADGRYAFISHAVIVTAGIHF